MQSGTKAAVARGTIKAVALAMGGGATMMCLAAVVQAVWSGPVRMLLLVAVGCTISLAIVAALVARRVGSAKSSRIGRMAPRWYDAVALTWLLFSLGFAVAARAQTSGVLADLGKLLADGGQPGTAQVAYRLAAVRPSAAAPLANRLLARTLLAIPAAAETTPASTDVVNAVNKNQAPSVATVTVTREDGDRSGGSGCLVADGIVATRASLVGVKNVVVEVRFPDGARYTDVKVRSVDQRYDVALLLVGGTPKEGSKTTAKPMLLRTAPLLSGMAVVVIGNPLGLTPTLAPSALSFIETHDDLTWLKLTTRLAAGSAGSGLVDDAGALIGIALPAAQSPEGPQDRAAPASAVAALLAEVYRTETTP